MSFTDSPLEKIFLRVSDNFSNKLKKIDTDPNNKPVIVCMFYIKHQSFYKNKIKVFK